MTDWVSIIERELEEASRVLDAFRNDAQRMNSVREAAELFSSAITDGNKALSCGNGGSMCDAMHFAEELTGQYRDKRKALPAIAIADSSHISCIANDSNYEAIFSRYIEALGRKGDVLLAISTSGNSPNILAAAQTAKKLGIKVVALTGKGGGKLGPLADIMIDVDHHGYADRIQEVHIKVIHILILLIEQSLK